MAVPTTAAGWIIAIDTAINAVLLNQSYSIGDRTFTRASLNDLRKMREFWSRQNSGGGIPYNCVELPDP